MSSREIIYCPFYLLAFTFAFCFNIIQGVGGHTPPMAFVIEILTIPIGVILLLIDGFMGKSTKVHGIGLGLNGLLLVYILLRVFVFR
jgi:hypothetical protein